MSRAEAEKLVIDAIGDKWFVNVAECELDRGRVAYIAQMSRSVCLGAPIVVIEQQGDLSYASVSEARRIVSEADERGVLDKNLFR